MCAEPDREYVRGVPKSWAAGCGALEVTQGDITEAGPQSRGRERLARLEGPCPACGHMLSKVISASRHVYALAPGRRSAQVEKVRVYVVTCNCVGAHASAPEGVSGCGAQGAVKVTPKDGTFEVTAAPLTVEQRDADEWIERARAEQLPRVRAFAGQWAAVLGIMTALIAAGTIFDADQDIYKLAFPGSVAYVALASLALVTLVVAVMLASQAAGFRELDDVPADVARRMELQTRSVADCRSRLAMSQFLTLCSVLLIAGALYLRFFGAHTGQ